MVQATKEQQRLRNEIGKFFDKRYYSNLGRSGGIDKTRFDKDIESFFKNRLGIARKDVLEKLGIDDSTKKTKVVQTARYFADGNIETFRSAYNQNAGMNMKADDFKRSIESMPKTEEDKTIASMKGKVGKAPAPAPAYNLEEDKKDEDVLDKQGILTGKDISKEMEGEDKTKPILKPVKKEDKSGGGSLFGTKSKEELDKMKKAFNPNAKPKSSASTSQPAPQPTTTTTTETTRETEDIPKEGVEISLTKPKKVDQRKARREEPDPVSRDYLNKFDLIPVERLNDKAKTAKELKDDIRYFIKNFRANLATEIGQYARIDKNNIAQLRQVHRQMVGKLKPRARDKRSGKARVGMVIDPDEYLKEKFNEFMAQRAVGGLEPKDLILDVGKGTQGDKDRETRDFGSFEVRSARHGLLATQKEPLYGSIPKTIPDDVDEQKKGNYRTRNIKLPTLKTKYYSKVDTAKREIKNNPFLSIPKKDFRHTRINYLY